MTTNIQQQIEEMKKQTIGAEIEMAEITREKACRIVATFFGTTDTVYYEGGTYSMWTCKDNRGRTWRVMSDSSIRASVPEKKAELVTPILTYADIETLQAIVRLLRKEGAISNPKHGCGVHIHIGANGHNAKTMRHLANIMASHESLLTESLKIDGDRIEDYCQTVDRNFLNKVNSRKPTTMAQFANIWYESQDCSYNRGGHYNDSRYHMLNYHATFTKGTIEFRLFQFDNPTADKKGGLHAGQLKSYIQLCLALSQMAKTVTKASSKPQQNDNPKYAMRTWLLRLGFIGEEFETAREILTRNLRGDAAFRNGRNAG